MVMMASHQYHKHATKAYHWSHNPYDQQTMRPHVFIQNNSLDTSCFLCFQKLSELLIYYQSL
ncbi:unnamed protein product [Brassica napus]|uniref:(rape) hypothetical protein n=1 Tax=Brassica napus TaxID=3708 RepID=A0A816PPJ6_BRANA|nr:unnamed protein product [Brassica napus]